MAEAKPPKKKRINTETAAGAVAGAGTLGVGAIDLRPKADVHGGKYLGEHWGSVKKHIKPGDVIVGANRTAPEALSGGAKDFKTYYKKYRKEGLGRSQAFKKALPQFDPASVVSKFSDPSSSHGAVFTGKSSVSYGGGWWSAPYEAEMPKDAPEARYWKSRKLKQNPHFVVLRPKKGVSMIPEMIKSKGAIDTLNYYARRAGGQKDYKGVQAIGHQIMDWITPKFRRTERDKSKAVLKAEACSVGGTCGTTGAVASKRTVGGKEARKVLPKDFLRSSDYEVVGRIGRDKTGRIARLAFNMPKYLVKGTAAAAAGTAVWAGVKGWKALTADKPNTAMVKKSYLKDAYEKSVMRELGLL